MKRVLVLAYYFPPLGGAGVQRTVKFLKHARNLGYDATVVTGPQSGGVDWTPPDPVLAAEVPADQGVLRASDPQPSPGKTRIRRWARLPSPFESWWEREATRLGRTVLDDVDLVYASMSPFGTAAVAQALSRESAKPWVADLRDPWALDEWAVYPTALHRALERRRMRKALWGAAAVIMNTAEAAKVLLDELPEFRSRRVVTIPNGWDRDDFEGGPPAPRADGRFKIVYAGYTHVAAGRRHRIRGPLRTLLGASVSGLDILPRSHVFLLEALERLRTLDPELASRVELHVAGAAPVDIDHRDERVVHHGYLPHDDAVRLMRSADALFLPMHDLPYGTRARTVPGKTYEYVASGRPILAALPDGDARDLLSGFPNVWLCRPTDVEAMARALREIDAHDDLPSPPRELVDRFERQVLAKRLVAVFDDVL